LCHNRLANLVACLLYAVQVASSIGIRAPFELGRRLRQSPVLGARRLHTTTSSIETYEEELDGGLAAPRPTRRSYDGKKHGSLKFHGAGPGRGGLGGSWSLFWLHPVTLVASSFNRPRSLPFASCLLLFRRRSLRG